MKVLKSLKDLKFPSYSNLYLGRIEDLEDEEFSYLNDFFVNSTPASIKYLRIEGNDSAKPEIEPLMKGLPALLGAITTEVWIHGFSIDQDSFTQIIESCYKVPTLKI
mmetsp:Transcript_17447/g.20264  ORF Transcript_17447/g.20264 Transcript_17447/m.20264 type:complete len:107 (+) Transcript_17447:149-469(+)